MKELTIEQRRLYAEAHTKYTPGVRERCDSVARNLHAYFMRSMVPKIDDTRSLQYELMLFLDGLLRHGEILISRSHPQVYTYPEVINLGHMTVYAARTPGASVKSLFLPDTTFYAKLGAAGYPIVDPDGGVREVRAEEIEDTVRAYFKAIGAKEADEAWRKEWEEKHPLVSEWAREFALDRESGCDLREASSSSTKAVSGAGLNVYGQEI